MGGGGGGGFGGKGETEIDTTIRKRDARRTEIKRTVDKQTTSRLDGCVQDPIL